MKKESGFKTLKVWGKGMEIVTNIYSVTKLFPNDERYGLVSQMRRAAVSIPSNIAEGYARKNEKEFKQFLYIALGSLAELETQLILSEQLNYCSNQVDLIDSIQHERFMLLKLCHQDRKNTNLNKGK